MVTSLSNGAHTRSVYLPSLSRVTSCLSDYLRKLCSSRRVLLCKSLHFSPIDCAVSPVNRTVSSVRTRSPSIPYRNEEKKRPLSLSLRDKQSSIHFSKRFAQCLQQAYSILLLFFFGPSLFNDNLLLQKTERTEKKSRGNCEAARTFSSGNCTDFYSVLSSDKLHS